MFAFERVPEDTASLLALDRKIAEQAHAFLGEVELKVQSPDVIREKVMLIAEHTKTQEILHALFQQHMSMVLRRCQSHVIADDEKDVRSFCLGVSPKTRKGKQRRRENKVFHGS